jgi:hypothetical protein
VAKHEPRPIPPVAPYSLAVSTAGFVPSTNAGWPRSILLHGYRSRMGTRSRGDCSGEASTKLRLCGGLYAVQGYPPCQCQVNMLGRPPKHTCSPLSCLSVSVYYKYDQNNTESVGSFWPVLHGPIKLINLVRQNGLYYKTGP